MFSLTNLLLPNSNEFCQLLQIEQVLLVQQWLSFEIQLIHLGPGGGGWVGGSTEPG